MTSLVSVLLIDLWAIFCMNVEDSGARAKKVHGDLKHPSTVSTAAGIVSDHSSEARRGARGFMLMRTATFDSSSSSIATSGLK